MTEQEVKEQIRKSTCICYKCYEEEGKKFDWTPKLYRMEVDVLTMDDVIEMTAHCHRCGFTERQVYTLDDK